MSAVRAPGTAGLEEGDASLATGYASLSIECKDYTQHHKAVDGEDQRKKWKETRLSSKLTSDDLKVLGLKGFKEKNDDYRAILSQALADRLAEAFAEHMHERVRKECWAYASDEKLSNQDLIEEKYQGIRPAPGYPAQPDHTEKATLFKLLDAEEKIGVKLTESYAMWPGASVSGMYFSHPQSEYFGVGKIERDQVVEYAKRKGMELRVMERWLAPILNYTPGQEPEEEAA